LRATPLDPAMPGVEVHAQLLEHILSGRSLVRPDYALALEQSIIIALGLVLALVLRRVTAAWAAVSGLLVIAMVVLGGWLAFRYWGLLFDPVYPALALGVMTAAMTFYVYRGVETQRTAIRSAFGHYLSPAVIEEIIANPDKLELGGEVRELTLMFSDVRNFTSISEQLSAFELTRFINELLTPLTEVILRHRGTVDKYMGDAIMAFWNAPFDVERHAARACEAAIAMQAHLATLNAEWQAEAEAEGRRHIPVVIGIGLNTGQATVGNFGSEQRLTYSCLGDEVNLASRLEGQCKIYGVGIVVGENTCRAIPDFATLELDLIVAKGKSRPVRMYALLGDALMAGNVAYRRLVERQAEFLALYRRAAFVEALRALEACVAAAEALGWRQGYYGMMRARVDGLIDDSPPDWNGVYVAREK
jgi:adenylate cyclase